MIFIVYQLKGEMFVFSSCNLLENPPGSPVDTFDKYEIPLCDHPVGVRSVIHLVALENMATWSFRIYHVIHLSENDVSLRNNKS